MRTPMRNRRPISNVLAVLALATAGLFTAACTTTAPATEDAAAQWLAEYDLGGSDARTIIEHLDALPVAERPEGLIASVEPETLVLFDDQENESSMPLPDDEFYLSFAPYVEQTHDCYFHSLTTCLGELGDAQIHVTVTDTDTDEVLVDETVTTFDNGFAGLWLPRDITATLTVTHGDRSATVPITTDAEAPTCITTLHMT